MQRAIRIGAMAAAVVLATTGCTHMGSDQRGAVAQGAIISASGDEIGNAKLLRRGERLVVRLTVRNLPEGLHGVHLHQVGNCEGPGFATAGGHLDTLHRSHGHLSANPKHLGDLPNLIVASNGEGSFDEPVGSAYDPAIAAIFDSDGTAVVVHQDPDDYKTDPSGNSGKRIACAVLKPFS